MIVDGTIIKQLRVSKGYTVSILGRAADLSSRRIQQIEANHKPDINRNVAESIASFLGVKLEAIARGE